MKIHFAFVFALSLSVVVYGQFSNGSVFNSDDFSNPEIHADGIFKFFIESENEMRFGNIEQALLILDNAVAENPYFVEVYLHRSKLLAKLGRHEEAKKDLVYARRLNPYVSDLLNPNNRFNRLKLIAFQPERYKDLIEEYESAELRSNLGSSIDKKLKGDWNGALRDLAKVFDNVSGHPPILLNFRGNIHFLRDDFQSAVEDYSRAIRLTPDDASLYFNRGLVQLFTFNRWAACEDLEKSIQLGYEGSDETLKHFCYH